MRTRRTWIHRSAQLKEAGAWVDTSNEVVVR